MQVHWAFHNLCMLSRRIWAASTQAHAVFEMFQQDGKAMGGTKRLRCSASLTSALKHMHHVLVAIRQTMLHSALYSAWQALTAAIDRAQASVQPGATSTGACCSVDDLLHTHEQYLAAAEAACWMDGSDTSQVRCQPDCLAAALPCIMLSRNG